MNGSSETCLNILHDKMLVHDKSHTTYYHKYKISVRIFRMFY